MDWTSDTNEQFFVAIIQMEYSNVFEQRKEANKMTKRRSLIRLV